MQAARRTEPAARARETKELHRGRIMHADHGECIAILGILQLGSDCLSSPVDAANTVRNLLPRHACLDRLLVARYIICLIPFDIISIIHASRAGEHPYRSIIA